jgi:HSP20 family molecular chaperone IbpA
MAKRSLWSRLTGGIRMPDEEEVEIEENNSGNISDFKSRVSAHLSQLQRETPNTVQNSAQNKRIKSAPIHEPDQEEEGQLAVDVYQTPGEIVVQTMVAGVRPEDLQISISRDMVTVKGKREEARTISEDNYYAKELYWGTFSRTIVLPQEIDPEGADAIERHGLLIIKMPKLDRERKTSLKVKSI